MFKLVFVAVIGLILGSFINALVWRLHEQSAVKGKKSKKPAAARELSILRGRSMCPNCRHELSPLDLIPVLSWAYLRGRCRYCSAPISWQYPVVELSTSMLFVFSYVLWPSSLHGVGLFRFCLWLIFLVGFVALAVYDFKWFLLPDRIVYPLVGLAVVQVVLSFVFAHAGWQSLLASLWGVLIASGIFYVLYQVSDGAWIGGGDVKLGLVLGILIGGPLLSVLLLFVASVLGTLVSLPLLAVGKAKRSTPIPFGPFLIAAAIIVVLFGGHFAAWFSHFGA